MRYPPLLLLTLLVACGPADSTDATSTPAPAAEDTPEPAPGATGEAPLPGDPGPGAEIYQAYCLACHMPDGTGLNGVLAADWVTDMTRRAKSDDELLESITHGVDDTTMVAWEAMLSPQQRKDVLSYVRVTYMGHSGKR